MSWLLLDAGNSALKWALLPDMLAQWPVPLAGSTGAAYPHGTIGADAPDLAVSLAATCAQSAAVDGMAAPSRVAGCAVTTPERIATIEAALRAAGAPPAHWLTSQAEFAHDGIALRNNYRDVRQLGADRWHALIGARALHPRTALAVINAGTATTVDGVLADGQFCGGIIAPGVDLMSGSLARGTARLPLAAGEYVDHPDNTDDAIRTGVLDAQLGLIERRIRRIRETAGARPQVILAGGNGAALIPLLHPSAALGPVSLAPDLVLRGLWHHARAVAAAAIAPAT